MIAVGSHIRKKYELKMPVRYVEMTEEEMEYDGGFINWGFSAIISVAGWACTVVGNAIDNDALKTAGNVAVMIGLVTGPAFAIKGLATVAGKNFGLAVTKKAIASEARTLANTGYGLTVGMADNFAGSASMFSSGSGLGDWIRL